MTDAIASFGTLIQMGDGGDPESFATVAEVLDIGGPEETTEFEDATNHSSPASAGGLGWQEEIPVIQAGGEVSFDVNYIPGHASHQALITAKRNGTLKNFKAINPDSANTTENFAAYVSKVGRTRNVKGKLLGSITLRITGAIS